MPELLRQLHQSTRDAKVEDASRRAAFSKVEGTTKSLPRNPVTRVPPPVASVSSRSLALAGADPPRLPRGTMSSGLINARLRAIRHQTVNRYKVAVARTQMAKEIEAAANRNNLELEYNRLVGASQLGAMTPYVLARVADLKLLLGK